MWKRHLKPALLGVMLSRLCLIYSCPMWGVPALQFTDPLSHYNLHLPPGRRVVWWKSCGREISLLAHEEECYIGSLGSKRQGPPHHCWCPQQLPGKVELVCGLLFLLKLRSVHEDVGFPMGRCKSKHSLCG